MSVYTGRRLARLIADRTGRPDLAHDAEVVGHVLPFKVSAHVTDQLIDWSRAPDDPLYRLVMPHRDMLASADFAAVEAARDAGEQRLRLTVSGVRDRLDPYPQPNPYPQPSGRPRRDTPEDGQGLQQEDAETLLVFPRQGQTCHSYCAYCFRWPQFTGETATRPPVSGPEAMTAHLDRHPEITDVLLTGGDPLVMRTELLDAYVAPLLAEERRDRIRTVSIGTKAVSFSPERFLTAPDADDLLRLFERVVASGRRLALTLHVSHPRELHPEPARHALRRLRDTGAVLRSQAPVVRHVNDDPDVWARMWQEGVELGIVPCSMFVERDAGPRRYFGLPLSRALTVYADALRQVSGPAGAARASRGPVMSTELGTIAIEGIAHLPDGPAFALRVLRARDPALVGTLAHARYDPVAQGWSDLVPYAPHDRRVIPHEPLTLSALLPGLGGVWGD
ncbi:KamA family radical SAM protein [Streptomyces sp. NPDC003035]|uniref:KamA family radical SAM protein n=1 Tax=Streptomyces sp. NPDC003035 TaxID=3364676 RepID=UPI0036A1F949